MVNLVTQVPNFDVPIATNRGIVTEPWFIFFMQLYRRTGNNSGGDGQLTKSDIISFDQTFGVLAAQQQQDLTNDFVLPMAMQQQLPDLARETTYAPAFDFSNVTITGGSINGTSIGATTPSTGAFTTISATGLISPTSTIGIKGTATNDNAQAGSIGEIITNTASAVALTTATAASITSVSLTAGDWDVSGSVEFNPSGVTTFTAIQGSLSITNNALTTTVGWRTILIAAFGSNAQFVPVPTQRLSLSATTTVYIVGAANFTGGTMAANAFIRARRVR